MGTRSNKLWFFLSLLLLFVSLKSHIFICASDTIAPGQSLSGNQTLISANGVFELGFFTPGNNSQNHYIGIWYIKGSVQTKRVVWVANRDAPISDPSSSEFKLVQDGNLILYNELKAPSWSTNITRSSNTFGNSTLVVLGDDGNLVFLRHRMDDPSDAIWQSFDYPTNTWLPGQRLGVNLVTGLTRVFTAWTSVDDPSPGNYSLQLDQNGRDQYMIMWNGVRLYWISGEWNGQIFSAVPEMGPNVLYNISYVSNWSERYFTYNLYNNSVFALFMIDPSGQLIQFVWSENDGIWLRFWAQPRQQCNVYAYCGAFSSCSQNDSSSCECLPGFQLSRHSTDWVDNSYRCERRTRLKCQNRTSSLEDDKFLTLTQTVLPVNQQYSSLGSAKACESACLNSCSCSAYAYESGQCSTWNGELLNVQPLSQGDIGGGDLHLRLAALEMDSLGGNNTSSTETNRNKKQLWLIVALPVALSMLIASFISCWLWKRKLKRKDKTGEMERSQDLLLFDTGISVKANHNQSQNVTKLEKSEKKNDGLPLFTFASVSAATNNFSDTNKLGQGGFGPVYKGKLMKGGEVAVKRLSKSSGQGLEELRNETQLIAKLQHRNLVRILGCCIEGEEKILVYEYMPNKSLDSFIFDPTKRGELDWETRVHIIQGIAQGLLYLHQYSRLRIIHRDLKASNILLDKDMNPKISDFGMARIFGGNDSQANTNRIVGTYGYMPPEYAIEGIFSVKSDVFSFGVLVLEIVSGKKNTGFYLSDSHNLLEHVWNLWKSERGLELMDPILGEPYSMPTSLRYIHVGLLCVQEHAVERPTMSDVVGMLNNESMVLPSPKHPAFIIGRRVDESSNMKRPVDDSVNAVTLSMLEAR